MFTFQKHTLEVVDNMFEGLTGVGKGNGDLMFVLAAGSHRETGTLAQLEVRALRWILSDAGIKYPGTRETAEMLVRYILEAEWYNRQGDTARAQRIQGQLNRYMSAHTIKFTTDIPQEEVIMATETAENITNAEATPKFAKKGASKKTVTKGNGNATTQKSGGKVTKGKKAAKPAKKDKAAEGEASEPTRYANDTRKIKVVIKDNPHRENTGRYEAFEAVRSAKTVADYAATGHKPKYLSKWVEAGHIELN